MTTIMAKDLTVGSYYHSRTPFGLATYLVVHVSTDAIAVTVSTLREYKGQVANYLRVYASDEAITFRSTPSGR